MTTSQKEQIAILRGNGQSYAAIAEILDIGVNTIKSYCQRSSLGVRKAPRARPVCEQCKKPMKKSTQANRRFCSNACRMAWWKAHPERRTRTAVYHFVCPICYKPFTAYGNNHRVYCSRKCYGKSRAKAVKS